ncbi:hypothetical protein [Streptomyces cinereospinus]|uniref:Secreted protein n=1 Tax=Streptomyces cinereospinus TaxID=285561 RepID=A0ABV5N828_9ACTN
MKPTTRGTLAAVLTCMAAAATGAAAASPAAAVPVPVPLEGAETALGVELPRIGAEIPAPKPGSPEGPRYVEGRLLPERALPQLPVSGGLPGADLRAPLPRLLADGFDHLDVSAPASDLRALAPGLDVDAPLTAPDRFGLPDPKLPEVGVPAPALRTVPAANLATGPGL